MLRRLYAFLWTLKACFGRRDGTGPRMWFSDCWWLSKELIGEEEASVIK